MSPRVLSLSALLAVFLLSACGSSPNDAAAPAKPAAAPAVSKGKVRPLTRLVFEDHKNQTLRWADVQIDEANNLSLAATAVLPGVKGLNADRQKLVQLRESQGLVVAGVRDDDDGQFESGWVLIDSGVRHHDHGDHGHWSFKNPPSLAASILDKRQGNPAHVYKYDERFFIANDKNSGYTRIDPAEFLDPAKHTAALSGVKFLEGGGNHITLAVVEDKVGYSAWIDGGGPRKGQVDVTLIHGSAAPKPSYSFHLPTGGIHGAAVCSGKVFFAPSDGVCWVDADMTASKKPEDVTIHHISLGKFEEKPRRTGAFASDGKHVIFNTGKETDSHLAILDASQPDPKPILLKLNVKAGAMAVSPTVAKTASGQVLAFVFHDHPADVELTDQLEIVDLDPNCDGDFADAAIVKTMAVGPSEVEGHYGHHAIAFDSEKHFAFFTNPGAGTVTALSLKDFKVAGEFAVSGKPTAVVAIGGREVED